VNVTDAFLQIAVPLAAIDTAGVVIALVVTVSTVSADTPHSFSAATSSVTLPVVASAVVAMDDVVEVPLHPAGTVHMYDVAPLTGLMLYVLTELGQMLV
jgi:energy-converting hydrogenase Eha subunit A